MKLTTVILLSTMLHVHAGGFGQANVTISLKNADLPRIFYEVKKKTGITFLYSDDVLPGQKKFDVNVREKPITTFLDDLFVNSGLSYKFFGNNL
ncbi:MAG: STN domain-containing protein, partial [Chitinophagaceae bacterium]|nr:STN domain-containing protein [Chitinophagaceae bacterium]